ncbi:ttcA [Symbiodinium sp. CCMP2456]|nr:ttcA [Symbiodinium sp. CCMP2456]
MLRYDFEHEDFEKQIRATAFSCTDDAAISDLRQFLRSNTIGIDHVVKTPFGVRRLAYGDFTASGRSLRWIEDFIKDRVLPVYGNTHTLSTATARQSTFFRNEARQIVKHYLNATHEDALIFCGAGTTGAVQKFVSIMCRANWLPVFQETGAHSDGTDVSDGYLKEDRWGSFECTLCGVRLKTEAMYRAHQSGEMHQAKLREVQPKSPFEGTRRLVVFCDALAHHSSLLPFRELTKRYVHVSTEPLFADSTWSRGKTSDTNVELEVCTLPLDSRTGLLDEKELLERLVKVQSTKGAASICVLSAASNVTGLLADVPGLTSRIHQHGGIACWDFAATAGHLRPDLNPPAWPDASVDVAFFSPHKLLGGPGSVGLLQVKKRLLRNAVPAVPGGGVVFFVDQQGHSYIQNAEDREEAGTPDIVGCIRTGLVYHLHTLLPEQMIEVEHRGLRMLLDRWALQPRIEVLGKMEAGQNRAAIVSFMIRYGNKPSGGLYLHYNYVVALLNDLFGIQARGGCACAGPYAQKLLGIDADLARSFDEALLRSAQEVLRPGFVRLGVHFTMSDQDVELLAAAVEWIATNGWRLLPAYSFCVETGEWYHRLATPQQDREWLSSLVPPVLQSSPLRELEASLGRAKDSAPPEDVLAAADAALATTFKGENPIPLSSTKCPLLDAEYAHLTWFALPTDAAAALRSDVPPLLDAAGAVFTASKVVERPSSSAFAVADATESTSAGSEPGEGSASPDADEDIVAFEFGCDEDDGNIALADGACPTPSYPSTALAPKVPKSLRSQVAGGIKEYDMIREGDRLLVGLSGGKDSLTMLHVLLELQRRSPVKFQVAAATVNPETPEFSPQPLIDYMKALGVTYHFLSKPLIEMAKCHLDPKKPSICSFCARMKRGMLYTCMRENGYNVLCLGQHLDDFAESFLMSAFRNGSLRTMKANYAVAAKDLRVCRPLVHVREKTLAQFAKDNRLPVIADNCPACFAAPKERHRMKLMLSQQEFEHPDLFWSLSSCMKPLMSISQTEKSMDWWRQVLAADEDEDDAAPLSEVKPGEGDRQEACADSSSPSRADQGPWPHPGKLAAVACASALSGALVMWLAVRPRSCEEFSEFIDRKRTLTELRIAHQVRCKQQKQHLYRRASQERYHPALSKPEMCGSHNSLALARRLLQGTCFWLQGHEDKSIW